MTHSTSLDTLDRLWEALATVTDPEIDVTLLDLGVLRDIVTTDFGVRITLAPTRIGCPGLAEIDRRIRQAVSEVVPAAQVELDHKVGTWQPADISDRGRKTLAEVGYTVAPEGGSRSCPYCGSGNVTRTALFGGSVCKQPFSCQSCGSTFDELAARPCTR